MTLSWHGWNIMFAYSLNELNICLKLKRKSFRHKGRNSNVQNRCHTFCISSHWTGHFTYILWNNFKVKAIGCGHRIKASNLWSPLVMTLWSCLNYTLRTSSNLDKYSTKIKYRVDMKFDVQSHYLQLWHWPCLFVYLIWFFTSHQQFFQLNRDGSSWVEPVLS